MAGSEWQRRIERAEELGAQYSFAAEILRFYVAIARFQEEFYRELGGSLERPSAGAGGVALDSEPFSRPLQPELIGRFRTLLALVERDGPGPLQEAARDLRDGGEDSQFQLLTVFWDGTETGALPLGSNDFFARAFLQPYAAGIRSRSKTRWSGPTPYRCPFCKRKPGLGVLRPLGDGGQRSLVCSFCMAEWSSGGSCVRDVGKRIRLSFRSTPRRNSSTSAWKVAIVAGATSRRWTLRKADWPNLSAP